MKFYTELMRQEFIDALTRRPRPSVAELCKLVEVEPDHTSVHTFMPWLNEVRQMGSNTLARKMLTHLLLHGGKYGVRNTFSVAMWREPLVREVFDRTSLLQLCRKWAAAYPHEVFDSYYELARTLGHYANPVSTMPDDLLAAGTADAAKVVAVATRNLKSVHNWSLDIILGTTLPTATLYHASLRLESTHTNGLVLWGYTLAQPKLRPEHRNTLVRHIVEYFCELHRADPRVVGYAYRWLLDGITRATGKQDYTNIVGLEKIREQVGQSNWRFLIANKYPGEPAYVTMPLSATRTATLRNARCTDAEDGDEVIAHHYNWGNPEELRALLLPCRPPNAADKRRADQRGTLAF